MMFLEEQTLFRSQEAENLKTRGPIKNPKIVRLEKGENNPRC
jgi:hypothetical protein